MNLDHNTAQRIIDQLEKGIHGDIWIVDLNSHLLAGSSVNGCHWPDGEVAESRTKPVEEDIEHYINLPLSADQHEVGRLIFAKPTESSVETAHMAKTLAELIIHQHNIFSKTFDRSGLHDKLISDLLYGQITNDHEAVYKEAQFLGIELDVPRLAAVINVSPLAERDMASTTYSAPHGYRRDRILQQRRRRLIEQTKTILGDNPLHLYSLFDPHCFVILMAIDVEERDGVADQVKNAVERLLCVLRDSPDVPLSGGVGAYYPGWQALAQSYQDARFALETGQALFGPGRVFEVSDLGLSAFVCTGNVVTKSHFARHLLRPLLEKPELLRTLEVFLAVGLSVGVAAQELYMHRHGLTYRLKKIQELTGLDPTNFQEAAQLDAALKWYRVVQGEAK